MSGADGEAVPISSSRLPGRPPSAEPTRPASAGSFGPHTADTFAVAQDGGDKGRVGNVDEHHLSEVMLGKFVGAPLAIPLGLEAKSPQRLRATFVPLARNTDGHERGEGITERGT